MGQCTAPGAGFTQLNGNHLLSLFIYLLFTYYIYIYLFIYFLSFFFFFFFWGGGGGGGVSSVNAASGWIWCMETMITYHIFQLLTLHGSLNYVSRHFSLDLFYSLLGLSFDTIMSYFKSRWEISRANRIMESCLQKDNTTENISMDISSFQFQWKNYIALDVSNGVNVRFVHCVF